MSRTDRHTFFEINPRPRQKPKKITRAEVNEKLRAAFRKWAKEHGYEGHKKVKVFHYHYQGQRGNVTVPDRTAARHEIKKALGFPLNKGLPRGVTITEIKLEDKSKLLGSAA